MGKERTARPLCESCKKYEAIYIIDIHAAVTILGKLVCRRCCNKLLRDYPASSAAHYLQEYQ